MADFQIVGVKIAKVLGVSEKDFVEILKTNKKTIQQTTVNFFPVAEICKYLMTGLSKIRCSVEELWLLLSHIATTMSISTSQPRFPKSPAALSYRLNEARTALESIGITYEKTNIGTNKEIVLSNNLSKQSSADKEQKLNDLLRQIRADKSFILTQVVSVPIVNKRSEGLINSKKSHAPTKLQDDELDNLDLGLDF